MEDKCMAEKISRRDMIKKTVRTGLAIGGIAVLGAAGYKLFRTESIDEIYGPYPDDPRLKPLKVSNPSAPKPNIIIIYCDDLGYGDIGCYGNRVIRTPNIDRLAADGMMFTDYYACNAVCAPSRAGLLTGRHPFRTGIIGNPYPADSPLLRRLERKIAYIFTPLGSVDLHEKFVADGLSGKEITIAEVLKTAGYRTAMLGKWHLGDFSRQPEFNPLRHGFDQYLGLPHSNDMEPCPLYQNEKMLEADIGTNQARLTGMYTKEALGFIEKSKDSPFFLYFAHTFPHQPLYASEKFAGKSKAGKFGDAVEEIDWSVGEIMNKLKELKIEDNTIIFFTSDNGPWYEGSPGVFRGRKGQSHEGGFRVPFIVKWPGHTKPGTVSSEPVVNLDIFPTLLSLAGIESPSDRIIDGKNIGELLSGQNQKSPHGSIYFYHYDQLEGIRSGKWKYFRKLNRYVWPVPLDAEALPSAMGKKQLGNRGPLLYDLSIDPGENYNVINTYPDIAVKMENMLVEWEEQIKKNPRGFLI
jgi:arylsulfatase A-like enzyme